MGDLECKDQMGGGGFVVVAMGTWTISPSHGLLDLSVKIKGRRGFVMVAMGTWTISPSHGPLDEDEIMARLDDYFMDGCNISAKPKGGCKY